MDETPEGLRNKAERYRRMADRLTDQRAIQALQDLANRYEDVALELERLSTKSAKYE